MLGKEEVVGWRAEMEEIGDAEEEGSKHAGRKRRDMVCVDVSDW